MQKVGHEVVLKGIDGGGQSCAKRQIIHHCGDKIAKGSFSKFSGEPWTIKKLVSFKGPSVMQSLPNSMHIVNVNQYQVTTDTCQSLV